MMSEPVKCKGCGEHPVDIGHKRGMLGGDTFLFSCKLWIEGRIGLPAACGKAAESPRRLTAVWEWNERNTGT